MTRRLLLMRHAKSDWSQGGSDHDRPLNPRGQKAAAALGDWLRAGSYLPDLVLSSDAARTRETCARLRLDCEETFHRGLYLAPAPLMLKALHQAGPAGCVLMLGHNPGISDFAQALLGEAPDDPDFQRYPTGATAVIDFAVTRWDEVKPGSGVLHDFIIPRRLT